MKEFFSKINSNITAKIVIFAAGFLVFFLAMAVMYNVRSERAFFLKDVEGNLRLLSSTIENSLVDAMGRNERDEVQRTMERIATNKDIVDLRILSNDRTILRSSNPSEIGTQVDDEKYIKYNGVQPLSDSLPAT